MVEVASLDEVPLRSVWRDEARDFTPWLAAHPDLLGRELQMDLELEGKEVAVGAFSADVVLRDTNTGQRVVVENLLETTDHDHVGKLITYAAALEARWAVLVAKEFRPEHRSALTWLNSISGEGSGFFGIEVHAVRIADSPTAVRLDVVVEPDDLLTAGTCRGEDGVRNEGSLHRLVGRVPPRISRSTPRLEQRSDAVVRQLDELPQWEGWRSLRSQLCLSHRRFQLQPLRARVHGRRGVVVPRIGGSTLSDRSCM